MFNKHDQGQILVITAVALAGVLGVAALSIDAAFVYDKRNRLYAAADAAAKSGAFEVRRNPSIAAAALQTFANHEVQALGFNPAGATQVVVRRCNDPGATCSPPQAGDGSFVEALVSETTSTLFGRVLGWSTATPGARAVAGTRAPVNCLITNQDTAIGNTLLNLNGCGAGVGGNLSGNNPNAAIGGTPSPGVNVAGTCAGTCAHMGTLTQHTPAPVDPLASLPAFANPYGSCNPGVAATLSAGCYTGIAATVTHMNPGRYYITGTVNIDNLTGTNVFLFLTGVARLHAANHKALHLTAETAGTYTGVAIFQDRGDNQNFDVGNNFDLDVLGAVYMPAADVDFPNSLNFIQTGCTLFVARSLNIENGSGNMSNSGCPVNFGTAPFLSVTMAE